MSAPQCRLYIGGVRDTVSNLQLQDIFGKYGKIVDLKRNKFFSFVQYDTEQSAQNAIQGENMKNHFGMTLEVQFAKATTQSNNSSANNSGNNPFPREAAPPPLERERFEMLNYGRGGVRGRGGGGRGGGPPPPDRFDPMRESPAGLGRGGMGDGPPRGFGNAPYGAPPRGFEDGRDREDEYAMRDGPPYRGPPGPPGQRFPREEPPYRGSLPSGPPRDGFGGSRARDEGPPFGQREAYPPSSAMWGPAPPTRPPGPLAIPHQQRTNDVEIIVINKSITDYGEMIEQRLKSLAFSVDLLFPNEEVPLPRVLANIASRGTLFAILVTPVHQQHRSLTLNILHGAPQEHRNMPVDDAVTLISRNYEMYVLTCNEKQDQNKPPEDIRAMLEQRLAGTNALSPSQLDKLITFFTQEKVKAEMPSSGGSLAPPPILPTGTGTSLQEQDLQNRILNILNKGPSSANNQGPPAPVANTLSSVGPGAPSVPNPLINQGKPLLNDPTVQKALDSLIQGFNPPRMPMNR